MEENTQAQFQYLNKYISTFSNELNSNTDLLFQFNSNLMFFKNQISSIYVKPIAEFSTESQTTFRSKIYSLIKQIQSQIEKKVTLINQVANQLQTQNAQIREIQKYTLNLNKEFQLSLKDLENKIRKFQKQTSIQNFNILQERKQNVQRKHAENYLLKKDCPLRKYCSGNLETKKMNLLNDFKTAFLQERQLKRQQMNKNKRNFITICEEFLQDSQSLMKKLNLDDIVIAKNDLMTFQKDSQNRQNIQQSKETSQFQIRINSFVQKQKRMDNWHHYSPIDKLMQKRLKTAILKGSFESSSEDKFFIENVQMKQSELIEPY